MTTHHTDMDLDVTCNMCERWAKMDMYARSYGTFCESAQNWVDLTQNSDAGLGVKTEEILA